MRDSRTGKPPQRHNPYNPYNRYNLYNRYNRYEAQDPTRRLVQLDRCHPPCASVDLRVPPWSHIPAWVHAAWVPPICRSFSKQLIEAG